jgi:hypothetical protein
MSAPNQERPCRICGCSQVRPCVTSDGGTCAWSIWVEGLCDFCEATVSAIAPWLALQAENGRGEQAVFATQQLIAEALKIAHGIVDADDEATPRIVLADEAWANAYLRARAAGGAS